MGGADGGEGGGDDLAHEIDDGREGQFAGVLGVGFLLEQGVQRFGRQGPFEQTAGHHGERRLGRESLEHMA